MTAGWAAVRVRVLPAAVVEWWAGLVTRSAAIAGASDYQVVSRTVFAFFAGAKAALIAFPFVMPAAS
jgi:hypothetical protein